MAPPAAANDMLGNLEQCLPDPSAEYRECSCIPDVCHREGNYLTLSCTHIDEIPKNVTDRIGCL